MSLPAASAALSETGTAASADLTCVGPAAPTPSWEAYRADATAIPEACADGAARFGSRLPRATLFHPDFVPPRVWRASLSGQGMMRLGMIWRVNTDFVRSVDQPIAFDRNLVDGVRFELPAEGGRPVHVGTDAIDPSTGAASLLASRRIPEFGVVREVNADGSSRAVQLGVAASKLVGFSYATLGYTWTDSWETVGPLSAPAGSPASTAGSTRGSDRGDAGYAPRHTVYAHANWFRSRTFSVGLMGRLSSGTPFTPMVSGDVNGDGAFNDRAFVFAPNEASTWDPDLARDMDRLLREAPRGARDCLRSQLGRVAGHHSCRNPWAMALDVSARLRVGPRVKESAEPRIMIWILARNVVAGLDHLLHGSDGLRGWGQPPSADNTLLTVRGFDPETRRFAYEVNPRFGRTHSHALSTRSPLSLELQGRIVIGRDRVAAPSAGATFQQDPALLAQVHRAHLRKQLPNLPAYALGQNAPRQLHLTPEQAIRLRRAADSFEVQIEHLTAELVPLVSPGAVNGRPELRRIRELSQRAMALRAEGAAQVRAILSPAQWEALPSELRDPPEPFSPFAPTRLVSPPPY